MAGNVSLSLGKIVSDPKNLLMLVAIIALVLVTMNTIFKRATFIPFISDVERAVNEGI